MNLPLRIAWRYFRRPTDRLVSAVGIVSVLGLVIGVMALVVSMGLMTGYREDLQKKLLGGNAEIYVYSLSGAERPLSGAAGRIAAVPEVLDVAPVIFQQALVSSENFSTGEQVMIKGIEAGRARTATMLSKIVGPSRTFKDSEGIAGISLGKYLAQKLGVQKGSSVSLTVPTEKSGSFLPRTATFAVHHVYETGFFEFDAHWLFLDLTEAASLVEKTDPNLLEVKLEPGADLNLTLRKIDNLLGFGFAVSDWRSMNRQLFSMLQVQQLVLFIVIGLIVFVSTFNIVSTLIMTVHEKRREIGMLISMGAEGRTIRRIFVWYGTLVGIVGTAIGIFLGVTLCSILTKFELVSFGPEIAEVYFVSSIPFLNRPRDLMVIALFAVMVSFLATLIPSTRAARLKAVDAMRYE